jgi:hypothetical protein
MEHRAIGGWQSLDVLDVFYEDWKTGKPPDRETAAESFVQGVCVCQGLRPKGDDGVERRITLGDAV